MMIDNEHQHGFSKQRAPLQRVVVATDFSAGGMRAVTRAARLPLAPGASIALVHVLPAAAQSQREVVASAREMLEEAAVGVNQHVQSVKVETVVAFGEAYEEILRVAEQEPTALLVLGRHGTRRFRDLLLGTTAERAVRLGHVPVLIVHGAVRRPYRRLLATLELPPETSGRALDLAMRLLGPSVEERRVIHVRDDIVDMALRRGGLPARDLHVERQKRRGEASATIHAWLKNQYGGDLRWRVTIQVGDPRRFILAAASLRKPDLICLGTHARAGVARVLLGSVAEAVLRGAAESDVLIARPFQQSSPALRDRERTS